MLSPAQLPELVLRRFFASFVSLVHNSRLSHISKEQSLTSERCTGVKEALATFHSLLAKLGRSPVASLPFF